MLWIARIRRPQGSALTKSHHISHKHGLLHGMNMLNSFFSGHAAQWPNRNYILKEHNVFFLVEHMMNQNITHGGLQNKIINCAGQNKYTVSQTVTNKLLENSPQRLKLPTVYQDEMLWGRQRGEKMSLMKEEGRGVQCLHPVRWYTLLGIPTVHGRACQEREPVLMATCALVWAWVCGGSSGALGRVQETQSVQCYQPRLWGSFIALEKNQLLTEKTTL